MQAIHLSTLRLILNAHDPVDLKLWTKSGEIQIYENCIPLKFNFYTGTRQVKLAKSHVIRQIRDVCIFECNGQEVYL